MDYDYFIWNGNTITNWLCGLCSTTRTLYAFPWLMPNHIINWVLSIFFIGSSYLVEGFHLAILQSWTCWVGNSKRSHGFSSGWIIISNYFAHTHTWRFLIFSIYINVILFDCFLLLKNTIPRIIKRLRETIYIKMWVITITSLLFCINYAVHIFMEKIVWWDL